MEQEIKIPYEGFNKDKYEKFVLVADVGGNHTHSAILGVVDHNHFDVLFKNTIYTKDIDSISIFLNHNLKMSKEIYDIDCNSASIGVAGPLVGPQRKSIQLSHHELKIRVDEILLNTLLKEVILLNDFEALGYGIDFLQEGTDMIEIAHKNSDLPKIRKDATVCVIGAGHGLGSTILPYDKSKSMHVPIACEAGHMDFSPEIPEDVEFQQFVQRKVINNSRVLPSFERFVSGRGIINLWHFVRAKKLYHDTDIAKRIDFLVGNDKVKAITINYYNDLTCKKVVNMFIQYYAQFARNMALASLCYGGLYITGGIASHHVEIFQTGDFMRVFEHTDLKTDILRMIPVFIITNNDVGLYGCCNVAVNFSDRI